jgi:hypothetical protein
MTDKATINGGPCLWRPVPGAFAFQFVALAIAAWIFRHALNPDGVAYLQIAAHYARGEMNLAVSGFWGPLISWMIAPFLMLGVPPLTAVRVVMALSAMCFFWGCWHLFERFNLSQRFLCLGLWTSALVSIPWSVENITPDLLLSGLVSFAFAGMMTPGWLLKPRVALSSGLLWGAAYLCKAIALPLGILTCLGVSALWWRKQPDARSSILRSFGLTALGLAFVSVPWIAILSGHYGRITVGNSARFNHSLAGPSVVQRLYLLDQGFHRPPAGRITSWEDPELPYPAWSPLASWSNARHQLRIILHNLPVAACMLTGVSLAFPALVALAVLRRRETRSRPENGPTFWWALLPVVMLGGLYLPNYLLISEQRYFYPAFSFLWAAAGAISTEWAFSHSRIRRHGTALLAAAFLAPTLVRSAWHLNSTRWAGDCAHTLAQRIAEARLAGPVAGSGRLPGGRTGLYVAYLLQQPWFGDEPSPGVAGFKRSGASLILVHRGSPLAGELAADTEFINLDPRLFFSNVEAGQFPLQVFGRFSPLKVEVQPAR